MILNEELLAVERGEKGETMQKILRTLVMYGEAFGAERMVKITGKKGHSVIGTGTMTWKPVFELMQELIDSRAMPKQMFTADPRGFESHVPATIPQRAMFSLIFKFQKKMEDEWRLMGIQDPDGYTCTPYMEEVGNVPKEGEILGWAESSAVAFANSVIGARCNRNSGVIEMMSNILGYVPEFGLLTDEGRKADWIIEVKCSKMPEPQLLGSAIGFKVIEDVPYIRGLDTFLGTELTQKTKDYLKDMGAAAASNGSVGLYHVENLTPEAKRLGDALIKENAQVYVIDDAVIAATKASYPVTWHNEDGNPVIAFAGCPHFSLAQLIEWTDRFAEGLKKNGKKKVAMPTIFSAAPAVSAAFEKDHPDKAKQLKKMGVTVSGLCPLSYTANPLVEKTRFITASNKLRYYSRARFFDEEEFVDIVTGGGLPEEKDAAVEEVASEVASVEGTAAAQEPAQPDKEVAKGAAAAQEIPDDTAGGPKIFKGRTIVAGNVSGEALVTHTGFNTLANLKTAGSFLNPKNELIDHNNPELIGRRIPGKILCLPETIGSTTGGMVLFSVARLGAAPAAMLFSKPADPLAVAGACLIANWAEKPMIVVDGLGEAFLESVKEGDTVSVSEDGTVKVE